MRMDYLTIFLLIVSVARLRSQPTTSDDVGLNGTWQLISSELYRNGVAENRLVNNSSMTYMLIDGWGATDLTISADSFERIYHEPLDIRHAFDDSFFDVNLRPRYIELAGYSNGDGILRELEIEYKDDSTVISIVRSYDWDSNMWVGVSVWRSIGKSMWRDSSLHDALLAGRWKAQSVLNRFDKWEQCSLPYSYELNFEKGILTITSSIVRSWITLPDTATFIKQGIYVPINIPGRTVLYLLGNGEPWTRINGESTSSVLHIEWTDDNSFLLSVSDRQWFGGCFRMIRVRN